MISYVLGFLFTEPKDRVALIRKERPEWQRGKLNGIGGKINPGESPEAAMRREFAEETTVDVGGWKQFALLTGHDFEIYCFRAADTGAAAAVKTNTDEEVHLAHVQALPQDSILPNVRWLIPMAISIDRDRAESFVINEVYGG